MKRLIFLQHTLICYLVFALSLWLLGSYLISAGRADLPKLLASSDPNGARL